MCRYACLFVRLLSERPGVEVPEADLPQPFDEAQPTQSTHQSVGQRYATFLESQKKLSPQGLTGMLGLVLLCHGYEECRSMENMADKVLSHAQSCVQPDVIEGTEEGGADPLASLRAFVKEALLGEEDDDGDIGEDDEGEDGRDDDGDEDNGVDDEDNADESQDVEAGNAGVNTDDINEEPQAGGGIAAMALAAILEQS